MKSQVQKWAAEMRAAPTPPEAKLWEELREGRCGAFFTRQKVLAEERYIADFYCAKYKIALEVDGKYHLEEAQMLKDALRDVELYERGIQTWRYPARDVLRSAKSVAQRVRVRIEALKDQKSL